MNLNPNMIARRLPQDCKVNGIYVIKPKNPEDDPGVLVPVLVINGRFYSVKRDEELSLEGFAPGAHLEGPLTP